MVVGGVDVREGMWRRDGCKRGVVEEWWLWRRDGCEGGFVREGWL